MANRPYIVRDERMRERVIDLIRSLDLSKAWEVQIKRHRKRRSLSQNALYWKWLNEVADIVSRETGQDVDAIHDYFKERFLPAQGRKPVTIAGETVERQTTTELSTLGMKEYMDRVYAFVTSELGLLLPLPEEYHLEGSYR